MNDKRVNLLPEDRQHALHRTYFVRLAIGSVFSLVLLIFVAVILLFPTHLFLVQSIHTKEAHLASIESSAFSTRLAALSNDVAILQTLTDTPSASEIIRAALAVPRSGITISRFEYSNSEGKNSATLTISGISTTRDSLRNYQLALQNTPNVLSADLPISVYANDSNIPFTITMTLSL